MTEPNGSSLVIALRDNLKAQRQAMLADDLSQLAELTKAQQELLAELDSKPEMVSSRDCQLMEEVVELLHTNQSLARQSLAFARRMLEAVGGYDGKVPPGLGLDRKV